MIRRSAHRPSLSERGQTLALITVFMMSLLGMAALAIDAGSWYQTKRAVQAAADSAALAGGSQLPAGWSYAQTTAAATYAKNGRASDTVSYQNVTTTTTNDSVKVTASRDGGSYFARLFGFSSSTITASATATVKSFSTVSGNNIMPWGIMRSSWTPGNTYQLYTDTSSANNGALGLNYQNPGCSPGGNPNGANDYANQIATNTSGSGLLPCPLSLNETVATKTGNNSGKTASGLNTRITNNGGWKATNTIVQFGSGGLANILTPNSPQLVMVPVLVNNATGGNTWPNPPGLVKVVGFAVFVITSCGPIASPSYCSASDGNQVNAVFVGMQSATASGWTETGWNSTDNSLYTVDLTG
jgi:Flp pilus assembly protein TadG